MRTRYTLTNEELGRALFEYLENRGQEPKPGETIIVDFPIAQGLNVAVTLFRDSDGTLGSEMER